MTERWEQRVAWGVITALCLVLWWTMTKAIDRANAREDHQADVLLEHERRITALEQKR